jgi:hypothetical protein
MEVLGTIQINVFYIKTDFAIWLCYDKILNFVEKYHLS